MSPRTARCAFTLVELLVVIGIIALLISTLLPALNAARRSANAAACMAQLRHIGDAVRAYAGANKGYLHRAQNQSTWLKSWAPAGEMPSLRLINPNDTNAYWGAAYLPYTAGRATADARGDGAQLIVEFARRLWLCRASRSVDPAFGYNEPDYPISYGVNGLITKGDVGPVGPPPDYATTIRWAKLSRFRRPAQVILAQDAVESRVENAQRNMLSNFGNGTNLTDWRPGGVLNASKLDAVYEYYRHNNASNVLWLDGHVSPIKMSNGADVPRIWYEGK